MIKVPLYRIINLEAFISICINKEERYVNPLYCWEDTYEGYLLKKLETESGYKEVIHVLYDLFKGNAEQTINNLAKLQRARYSCFGQCWSMEKDSDAMWRIYSFNKHSVQLISNEERIRNMIDSNNIPDLIARINKVKYDLNPNNSNTISDIIYSGSKSDEAYYHKRTAFEHEKEVRVIIQFTREYMDVTSFTNSIMFSSFKINKDNISDEDKILKAVSSTLSDSFQGFYPITFPKNVYLQVLDLPSYIYGVRVHPQAEDWYVKLVESICKSYNLKFLGKSELYEINI
ncbi:Protein of unknown function [Lachnospiraceae bacterium]|nr:Protein of unknown function [Lachnospiraceae bacterium]